MNRVTISLLLVLFLQLVVKIPVAAQNTLESSFPLNRMAYRLELSPDGTRVINRDSGSEETVAFGKSMSFSGVEKFSKDTAFVIHHIRSHAETYLDWNQTADLPVDFLRTGPIWVWDGKTPKECIMDPASVRRHFPDKPDKVITAYVNMAEFSRIGNWDPSFDPSWDLDGDARIDEGAGPLPDYVDTKVFNAPWKNYVARYWTNSWRNELEKKIDLVAAENFDGVVLDVMACYWKWMSYYPDMNLTDLRARSAELVRWISAYAKGTYGSAFLVTINLDPEAYKYFPDLGSYVDGGYFQNAFFKWDGSGIEDGYGRSSSSEHFSNLAFDFIRNQGLPLLDMDHIGTGPVPPGLDFENYDGRINETKLLRLFRWAIDSGSIPFAVPVFMTEPYTLIPRFTRVVTGLPPSSDTVYRDWVIGSRAPDRIFTGDGDDVVYGGPGDDIIDGGAGNDTALFTGSKGSYQWTVDGGRVFVRALESDEGTDTLTGIERLVFLDGTETVQ